MSELITTVRAAKMLGVSSGTIRRWAASGNLAHVLTPGGRYLIPVEEIARILTPVRANGNTGAEVVDDVETESDNAAFPPELF